MRLLTQGPHKLLGQELWLLVAPGEQDVAIKSMAASQSLPAGRQVAPQTWDLRNGCLRASFLPPWSIHTPLRKAIVLCLSPLMVPLSL